MKLKRTEKGFDMTRKELEHRFPLGCRVRMNAFGQRYNPQTKVREGRVIGYQGKAEAHLKIQREIKSAPEFWHPSFWEVSD